MKSLIKLGMIIWYHVVMYDRYNIILTTNEQSHYLYIIKTIVRTKGEFTLEFLTFHRIASNIG